MKATLISAILLAISAVDAKKHRLCCCSGIDEDAPGKWSDKSPVCLQKPNEEIVAGSNRGLIMSNQLWNYNKDKKYPLQQESRNWYYAANIPANDNWVGGEESSGYCKDRGHDSTCWSPSSAEYRNAGTFKRSQNIDQNGEIVNIVEERDFDLVERKDNATKHHGAGYHKKHNSTHHHGNSSSTKHHPAKPTTTTVADLVERDLLEERKVNGTKTTKHHAHSHHPSGKPRTTFHQVTKSHHYGNGTKTKPHTKSTGSAGKIVYCNQYWKAPGCVDKPDPSAKPVVCGQYWKAKGCVPATTAS